MLTEPIVVGCINEARGGAGVMKNAPGRWLSQRKNTGKVPQTGVL